MSKFSSARAAAAWLCAKQRSRCPRRTAEKLHGTYEEIDAGHYPMLSHPKEIAEYLLARA